MLQSFLTLKYLYVSFLYFQSHSHKANTLLLEIFEIFQFCPALDTMQNCSSQSLKNGKSLPYVCKGLAVYEIRDIKKFSVFT